MHSVTTTETNFTSTVQRPVRPVKRKTRITIYLDDDVLAQFRSESENSGKGYQTLINAALRNRVAAARAEAAEAAANDID